MGRQLGLNDQTVSRWETGESIPNVKHYPSIIAFLGYFPFEIEDTLGGKIKQYRYREGLSQKKFAGLFRLPVKNIKAIEENRNTVTINLEKKLPELLMNKAGIECNS